jgi:CHAT domain-containing protein
VEAERAIRTGKIVKPIAFDLSAVQRVIVNLVDANVCDRMDKTASNSDAGIALMKSQGALDYKLAATSSNSSASVSILQSVCGSQAHSGGQSQSGELAPGYAAMVHAKGVFTEVVAPRKLTVLPGYSKERNEAVEALDGAMATASLAILPPDVQQRIQSLPPDARAQALKDYAAAHPGFNKDPEAAKRLREAFTNAWGKPMEKIRDLSDQEESDANPLAVLDMLRPGEAFVDVYKYRAREGDKSREVDKFGEVEKFGAEHYLAVISASSKSSRVVQLGPAAPIDAAINALLSGFAAGHARAAAAENRGVHVAESGKADPAGAWKALQRLIVQPLVTALPAGTTRILLSPDSSLALVPFESLLLDMGGPASVSIVPSAYDFARLRGAKASTTGTARALIVGSLDYGEGTKKFNPLPGTEREMKSVAGQASAAGFQTVTLSGSQATRAAIVDRIGSTQMLHLATHGFWSSAQSATVAEAFRSAGLALSQANSESKESLLTAEDILQLDLSGVQLVVLSACTSGQGRPVDGQGLLGFQTAFMAAGARSLLLSLWNVPDEATSVLMQHFYKALFTTPSISKSEALRQAQQQLRSDPEFADPRNWAAWVVIGDAL